MLGMTFGPSIGLQIVRFVLFASLLRAGRLMGSADSDGPTFFHSGACGLSVPARDALASREPRRVSAGPATAACRLLRRVRPCCDTTGTWFCHTSRWCNILS